VIRFYHFGYDIVKIAMYNVVCNLVNGCIGIGVDATINEVADHVIHGDLNDITPKLIEAKHKKTKKT